MKKVLICILIVLINIKLFAQESDKLIKNFRLDFAIPDHPAFAILDKNPDNILKPSNTQELFSIIYSDFLKSKTFIVPHDFSLEFSPAQLIGINRITFDDYRNSSTKRILYDAKLSVATKINDNDSLQNLAAGLRITWVDKTSLFYNQEFIKEAYSEMKKSLQDKVTFQDSVFRDGIFQKHFNLDASVSASDTLAQDTALVRKLDEWYLEEVAKNPDYKIFDIEAIRKKYRNANWNKMKFETAFAVRFKSADSLVRNNHYSKFEIYNTLAFPLGNGRNNGKAGWGQALLGVNLSEEKLDSSRLTIVDSLTTVSETVFYHVTNLTIAARLYAGNNAFKTFVECSFKSQFEKSNKISLNIGSEINISDGLWAIVNFGNNWDQGAGGKSNTWSSQWFWKIDVRIHLPEKKKI